jgi:hypothetical protein
MSHPNILEVYVLMQGERENDLNYVFVLSFCSIILLMIMRTRDMVINVNLIQKGVELHIFFALVSLHGDDLAIKRPFD